ncbi:hypothetical protein CEXT_91551 [Caerostris extrusa]|uniref:Uncharacterized protein n=1 Tax=Caerostris extrusa TaxID=172846 RepID=A0AAV4RRP5_CAEEX|nr:hypothetical protein CEXT_91551 [Caerostris extrusa]
MLELNYRKSLPISKTACFAITTQPKVSSSALSGAIFPPSTKRCLPEGHYCLIQSFGDPVSSKSEMQRFVKKLCSRGAKYFGEDGNGITALPFQKKEIAAALFQGTLDSSNGNSVSKA